MSRKTLRYLKQAAISYGAGALISFLPIWTWNGTQFSGSVCIGLMIWLIWNREEIMK